LAIVRKLVLSMGGNIQLSSHLGQGSTFTITLPLMEVRRETEQKELTA
jgi:signal transduction histidine kinase